MRVRAGRLVVGVVLAALSASCRDMPERTGSGPVVRISATTVTGVTVALEPAVASFRGLPYAKPPVGERRWAAPEPRALPAGRFDASRFAAACYQDSYNTVWYRRVGAAFGVGPEQFSDPPVSEDCLYLNVWAPLAGLGGPARKPVLVWVHGGSNRAGWSFEANYDGSHLAARGDVVVVTIAYRLGVFGFYAHPDLALTGAPANAGLLDQIEALRWVQAHIAAFGGDPDNVTVAGESAGAADIAYLIASPRARGLFRRAISESGGYALRRTPTLGEAQQLAVAIGNELAVADIKRQRELPPATVFAAAAAAMAGRRPGPVIDGHVVTAPLGAALAAAGSGVDLLIGSNENEFDMYVDDDVGGFERTLAALPPSVSAALAPRARSQGSIRRGHAWVTGFTDMNCPPYVMASQAAAGSHVAYVYRFARVRPGPGGQALLAYHGAEVPYVFDTHDAWLPGDDAERALTTAMMDDWLRFLRTGNPNADPTGRTPPDWPPWNPAAPKVMRFDRTTRAIDAPDAALCATLAPDLYAGLIR